MRVSVTNVFCAAILLAGILEIHSMSVPQPTEGYSKDFYEGDMILTEQQRMELSQRKITLSSPLWINEKNAIPYYTGSISNSNTKSAIEAGINHWESNTCLKFSEASSRPNRRSYYMNFIIDSGCYSYVGRVISGGQAISIGSGCEALGVVAHEIGHALGFHHEQSRTDRDGYVEILNDNIESGYEGNFNKANTDVQVPYDYYSVMHYGMSYFTTNGAPTLRTLTDDPMDDAFIGNRDALSFYDIKLANIAYECTNDWLSACNLSEDPCENDGYIGKDCSCVCRLGTSGDNCQTEDQSYYDAVDEADDKVNREYVNSAGTITSPEFPNTIVSRQVVHIVAPECQTVKVTFTDFNIRSTTTCSYDATEIRPNTELTSGTSYCGTDISAGDSFMSDEQEMVIFTQIWRDGYMGWSADVTFEDIANCEVSSTTQATTTATTQSTTTATTLSTTTATTQSTTTATTPTTTTTTSTTTTTPTTTTETTTTAAPIVLDFTVSGSSCEFVKDGDSYYFRNVDYPNTTSAPFTCTVDFSTSSQITGFSTNVESASARGANLRYLSEGRFTRYSGAGDSATLAPEEGRISARAKRRAIMFNIKVDIIE